MQLKEAYDILELQQGCSQDDAKKKYRELTKQWHPDINKAPEADSKFKKINEAYECVKNGKGNDKEAPSHYHRTGNPFAQQQVIQVPPIEVNISIDFKESVLGCKRDIKYSRMAKCNSCDGNGEITINNGCKACGGSGRTIARQMNSVFVRTCMDCMGKNITKECTDCKGDGRMHADASVNVSVPAGVINGNVLRLQGMGHYVGTLMGIQDQYTDAFCNIKVTPEKDLSIDGKDVVININIPLIDALTGCAYKVKTINGLKEINIKPQSRHKEEVIILNLGVGGVGNQRVILDVSYPTNVDKLIELLKDK